MTAKPRSRKNAAQPKPLMIRTSVIVAILLTGLTIAVLLYLGRPQGTGTTVQLRDIHGIGFSADGQQLLVPAHDGFRIYQNGRWDVPDLPVNDYMGYSAADDGFYSSGHPGPGSNLVNPLGLIRSTDGGQTFTTLDFEGETDFHLMSVGYRNHAIYVVNPSPNSRLSAGLYYSLDDGQTWEQSAGQGISGSPIQIAVHPTEAQTVAIASEGGLFLSNDFGSTFTQIGTQAPVTSVSFDLNGGSLFFGYQTLNVYAIETGETTALPTPTISGDDAISYIAVNPVSDQIAFASFSKDIYLSDDKRQSWEQIARQGVG